MPDASTGPVVGAGGDVGVAPPAVGGASQGSGECAVEFCPDGDGTPCCTPGGACGLDRGTGCVEGGDFGQGGAPSGPPAGTGGSAGGPPPPPLPGACTPPPSGAFQTTTAPGGPGGAYTIFRPTTLGESGFLHPPVAWGNGLGTTPPLYAGLLENLASQGFVVIANPGPGSNPQAVRQGLEWLIAQNGSGEYAGRLAVDCAATIGYSMGGGAAIGSGAHPAVKAVVSIHGLNDATENASGPVLILNAEGDTFVSKQQFSIPAYDRSTVQPTILASHAGGNHLDPLGDGGEDAAPSVAWLRYWLYGDPSAREWFFGSSCRLCSWPDVRRKNHNWD